MSSPKEKEYPIEPIEVNGEDPEVDFMATEKELYEPGERSGRKLSETIVEFVEKIGEGARRMSEHVHEDGAALANLLSGGGSSDAK